MDSSLQKSIQHSDPQPADARLRGMRQRADHRPQGAEGGFERTAAQVHRLGVILFGNDRRHLMGLFDAFQERGEGDPVLAPAHHDRLGFGAALLEPPDGGVAHQRAEVAVECARRTAALDVSEDGDAAIFSEFFFEHLFDDQYLPVLLVMVISGVMVLVILVTGILFALPNIYGSLPAVQLAEQDGRAITEEQLEIGEDVLVELTMPGGASPISIATQVAYRTPLGYGLKFIYRDGGGSRRLREMVRRLVDSE